MADLDDVVNELRLIRLDFSNDKKMMWRVMLAVILGAFSLVGLKLALP